MTMPWKGRASTATTAPALPPATTTEIRKEASDGIGDILQLFLYEEKKRMWEGASGHASPPDQVGDARAEANDGLQGGPGKPADLLVPAGEVLNESLHGDDARFHIGFDLGV